MRVVNASAAGYISERASESMLMAKYGIGNPPVVSVHGDSCFDERLTTVAPVTLANSAGVIMIS